jgi:histone H3/H4
MKLDPDSTPIVQNEAAILTTLAAELFVKSLAQESFRNAKIRGRNTIRYEDVAEARTRKSTLSFLETLLP